MYTYTCLLVVHGHLVFSTNYGFETNVACGGDHTMYECSSSNTVTLADDSHNDYYVQNIYLLNLINALFCNYKSDNSYSVRLATPTSCALKVTSG